MDVVVEDDDTDHDAKTEHDRLLITELGSVVTEITGRLEIYVWKPSGIYQFVVI